MAIKQQNMMDHKESTGPVWLTTFNDMMTLLMVFFVLLFSMGNLDVKRFKHFQNALQSAMGVLHAGKHAPVGIIAANESNSQVVGHDGQDKAKGQNALNTLDDTQGLEAEYTPKGIQLTLDDNMLFKSGNARLTPQGLALLLKISNIIKPLKRSIRVEGHTDDVPISTPRFPSNWELSTERATNVVKYFIDQGGIAPHYLSAVGYGNAKPKTDNISAQARRKNRRVEIILGPVSEAGKLH